MISFTFDWNCVLAVENGEPHGVAVTELVELHRSGKADVGITTVSASENLIGSKVFPGDAGQFFRRLDNLGWSDLRQINGPSVTGMTYIGMANCVDDKFESERNAIWDVLAAGMPRKLPRNLSDEELWSENYSKWRNVWCDVHTLWAHIHFDRDVFVTSNTKDFQNKFAELKPLGLRAVRTPREALDRFLLNDQT